MKQTKIRKDQKWRDEFYVTAYQLSRAGESDNGIARALGVSIVCLTKWRRQRPALQEAIDRGRTVISKKEDFAGYVYGRLPDHLKETWKRIHECQNAPNGLAKIEAILEDKGRPARQCLFLHALTASNFNASEACRMVGINKKTLDEWKKDPDFLDLVENEMPWHLDNFYEEAFVELAAAREPSVVRHAAATRLKHRGYGPETKVTGKIDHDHKHAVAVVTVDELDLPQEVGEQILEAYRQKKLPPKQVEGEVIDAP